ncbi:MAG: hypothetical protein JXA23_09200, partial [Bacteroidales bacterium]|nr:hypothetical protein [Bacteroidales bacterium]
MKTTIIHLRKSFLACFILLSLCPIKSNSQEIIRFRNGNEVESISSSPREISADKKHMKSGEHTNFYFPQRSSVQTLQPPLKEALQRLKKAETTGVIGCILGAANHVTLVVNKGYMSGDRAEEDYQPVFALIGLTSGVARMALSPIAPYQLFKAEQAVIRLQSLPGNEGKFRETLKSIRTAKYLNAAVPMLGITTASLMGAGYLQQPNYIYQERKGYYEIDERLNGWFIAAWATMGATLITSIVAT